MYESLLIKEEHLPVPAPRMVLLSAGNSSNVVTVTKVSDLKGRKIMFTSDQSYLISLLLEKGNLTADDVEIVNMDFASGVVALKNGAVDAGDLTEPFITQVNNSRSAVMLIPTNEYCPDWPLPLYYGPAIP